MCIVWLKFVVYSAKVGDVFIGYHADTAASIILQVCQSLNPGNQEMFIDHNKVGVFHIACYDWLIYIVFACYNWLIYIVF